MQKKQVDGQISMFDRVLPRGRMSPERFPARREKTSKSSLKSSCTLKNHTFMLLDLRPGAGNILGPCWEYDPVWLGPPGTLNTSESPKGVVGSSLSQILQAIVQLKYYLSRKACLGILKRSQKRGKPLPAQLKAALMAQAGLAPAPTEKSCLKAYHINQRDEGIDLGETSGALMTTINGDPAQAKQSGLRGERRSSGMSELSPLGGSEGYGACDDAQIQTFVTLSEQPIGFDGYNGDLTGDKSATLGTNCGMSTGRNGLIHPVVFAANQRDEVRDLQGVTGALQAQPGIKQQTFVMDAYSAGHDVIAGDITNTLRAQAHGHQPLVYENHGIDARYTGPHEVSPTISARCGTGGNNAPLVTQEAAYCISGNIIGREIENGGNGTGVSEELAFTLTTADHHAVFRRSRTEDFIPDIVASTECARQGKDATDLVLDPGAPSDNYPKLIRRLTPLECERLQGYPDGWTDIPSASDSARYKALGNSVAIPCVEFLMQGIAAVYRGGLRYELPQ